MKARVSGGERPLVQWHLGAIHGQWFAAVTAPHGYTLLAAAWYGSEAEQKRAMSEFLGPQKDAKVLAWISGKTREASQTLPVGANGQQQRGKSRWLDFIRMKRVRDK